jgi:hypothetical protein
MEDTSANIIHEAARYLVHGETVSIVTTRPCWIIFQIDKLLEANGIKQLTREILLCGLQIEERKP